MQYLELDFHELEFFSKNIYLMLNIIFLYQQEAHFILEVDIE